MRSGCRGRERWPHVSWVTVPVKPLKDVRLQNQKFVAYGGHNYWVCLVCDVTIWRYICVSKSTCWRILMTQHVVYSTCSLLVWCCTILCVTVLIINCRGYKLWYQSKPHSLLWQRHNYKNIRLRVERSATLSLCWTNTSMKILENPKWNKFL